MASRRMLLLAIAALLLLGVIAVALILVLPGNIGQQSRKSEPVEATNLALDVRYSYDPSLLTPAPFSGRAEYPLRLDGTNFSFYGKRIQGLGKMLVKDPAPLLYDFVGSQHMESFELWFGLELVKEPLYEDAQISGRLGLHQQFIYRRTADSRGWPTYFPASVTKADTAADANADAPLAERLAANQGAEIAYVEGWALFTTNDLFFFQAVSPAELTAEERQACLDVLNSMEFDVLLSPPEPDNNGETPPQPAVEDGEEEPPQP